MIGPRPGTVSAAARGRIGCADSPGPPREAEPPPAVPQAPGGHGALDRGTWQAPETVKPLNDQKKKEAPEQTRSTIAGNRCVMGLMIETFEV